MHASLSTTTIILLAFICLSCTQYDLARFVLSPIKPRHDFSVQEIPFEPDYSQLNSWDTVSNRLLYEADVFFIHPTTFYPRKGEWNQQIDDQKVNERTWDRPIKRQATAFFGNFNIFAPRYRQAHLYAFIDKKDNGKEALEVAYQDVERAFYYYWEKLNNGRPLIIASHSQGSFHANRLMKQISKDPDFRKQLVVAYIIGWPVTEADLSQYNGIQAGNSPEQTQCVVSWNTQGPKPLFSMVTKEGTLCVNPLNWRVDTGYVDRSFNKGAVFYHHDRRIEIQHYIGANTVNGKLVIDAPPNQKELKMPFRRDSYHIYDYGFFFNNIRENAMVRLAQWKEEKSIANRK